MATGTFSNNTSQNLTADVTWSSSKAAAATIDGPCAEPLRHTENRSADERRQEADGDLLRSAKLLA